MKSRILLISLSIVFLSGCVREESPLWYMTSDDSEINQHFKSICIDEYGHRCDSPSGLNRCIKAARKLSASEANSRLYQVGEQMQQMDMQRIQNHNTAVNNIKSGQQRLNVYNPSGQLGGYSQNGNWYNSDGTYAGFINKNNNIYGVDGQYIGFRKNNNYYNADGTYAGQSR